MSVRGPGLILVSGTHGSGKSTLAAALSEAMGVPRVSRDLIRSALRPSVPLEPGGVASTEHGRRSVTAFYALIAEHLTHGVSVIADQPFRRGVSEGDLMPLLDRAECAAVHCDVSRQTAIERCRQRRSDGIAEMLDGRDESRWARVEEPLDLGIAVLRVNTEDGYVPGVDEIVEFCRGFTG